MKDKHVLVMLKYFKGELNPFDCSALECALRLNAKKISVLAMAPMSVKDALEDLTRLNVNAYLVSDSLYAGSDTLATSLVMCEAVKKIAPDIVFCGRQSVDGDTAQVPPMLAKRLGYSFISKVIEISETGYKTRLKKTGNFTENTIYTFEKIYSLRFPSIFSRKSSITVWDNKDLKISNDKLGLNGSPTQVIKAYTSQVGRRFCKFISANELENVIKCGLNQQRENEEIILSEEKLNEVYYLGNIDEIALGITKVAKKIDYKNKRAEEIASFLTENNARTVLFSDDDDLKVLSAEIAVLTNSGLCADCISLRVENGGLVMTRPAQGGDITADIICKSKITMATVRTPKKTQKDVIFSFGKGAVDYIDQLKEIAKKYDAECCASRAVVDMGKMPYSSQVGLTGKMVTPKVYVAFGISGAVQHTTAISGAETVIAVNNDKDAKIFDYADFGVIGDIKDIRL